MVSDVTFVGTGASWVVTGSTEAKRVRRPHRRVSGTARHRTPLHRELERSVAMTILVTGATGTVGSHLIRHLLREGHKVRALTRDPATADLPEGVEVVAGDLTEVLTLTPVF